MFLVFDSSTDSDLVEINCNDTGCWVNHDILLSGQCVCFHGILALFVTDLQLRTKDVVKFTRLIDVSKIGV